jgi:hypothetical protein
MTQPVIACLDSWLHARLKPDAQAWMQAELGPIHAGDAAKLQFAFGAAGRHAPHVPLSLSARESDQATQAHRGWRPAGWRVDHALRARLVLGLPDHDAHHWYSTVEILFTHASLDEAVALYQIMPVLPFPELLRERAAEGVRSNMQAVFEAIALDNPFPAEQFDLDTMNQTVLKAFFLGVDVDRIVGLANRANPTLTRMLLDYAHERRAAGRSIDIRLWQVVGMSLDDSSRADLRQVHAASQPPERDLIAQVLG